MMLRTAALIVALLVAPLAADAQQPGKVYRIGHLGLFGAPAAYYEPLWQRLRELGYVYYKNVVMTRRTAWDNSSLQNFAAELVRLEVDLIFADSTLAALAARNATSAIPIVMIAGDPVRAGLVLSLARPGGNVTGFASLTSDLNAKRLELLKEASPRVSRVAVLWDPADPAGAPTVKEMQGAARALGVSLLPVAMRGPEDFQNAFAAVIKDQADALVITPDWDPLGDPRFQPILRFPVERRLPAMYSGRAFVDAEAS